MIYPGGKNAEGMVQWIINQLPPHDVYIEPFVGSGAVLRAKRPALASVAVDIDQALCEDLPSVFSAIPDLKIICCDAIGYLRKLRCPRETLIYCDPPYLMDARRSDARIYRHEFGTREQHEELLRLLLSLPCMVAVSGYHSSLYDAMLQGWRRTEKKVTLRYGIKAVECLWMNYPEPVALHDYRYLGDTFRERERLKRIAGNMKKKLQRMTKLERMMMTAVIAELSGGTW